MKKTGITACVLLLWVSFLYGQNNDALRLLKYRPGDWVSYPVLRYVHSVEGSEECIYFAATHGILRYHFFDKAWLPPLTASDGIEGREILDFWVSSSNDVLWCVTDAGIGSRLPTDTYWTWNLFSGYEERPVMIGRGMESLWARTGRGEVFKLQKSGELEIASIGTALEDEVRWGKSGKGLDSFYFTKSGYTVSAGGRFEDSHMRQYSIIDGVQDPHSILWVGIDGLGVGKADQVTMILDVIKTGPFSPDIHAMAWDDEGLWMGGLKDEGAGHAITYWNMETDTWDYYESEFLPGIKSDAVTAIETSPSAVWFGTQEGLARFDVKENEWKTFKVQDGLWDAQVTCLALKDSVLWIGTRYGINRMDTGTQVITKIRDTGLVHHFIYQIDTDEEGVWAGTEQGIFRYSNEDGLWNYLDGYGSVLGHEITAVSVYGNEVWFGSNDGIEIYDREKKAWAGFPNSFLPVKSHIYSILPDEKAVWVGTDDGALKYRRDEDRWVRFTTDDGLLDNSVRWILLDGDYVWFGTAKGLTRFFWNAPHRID